MSTAIALIVVVAVFASQGPESGFIATAILFGVWALLRIVRGGAYSSFNSFLNRKGIPKAPRDWEPQPLESSRSYVVWLASRRAVERYCSANASLFDRLAPAGAASGGVSQFSMTMLGASRALRGAEHTRDPEQVARILGYERRKGKVQSEHFVEASAELAETIGSASWEEVCRSGALPETYWRALADRVDKRVR